MIAKGTQKWNFFISLVESHVPVDEALMMTLQRFNNTIIDVMHTDLDEHEIEQD